MRILIASLGDIPVIQEMAQVVFRQTYREILSPEQMEYMMEWMYSDKGLKEQMAQGYVFYIAENEEGTPVGYMSVGEEGPAADGAAVYHLHKLYVLPSAQGQGVGKALLECAVEHVRATSAEANGAAAACGNACANAEAADCGSANVAGAGAAAACGNAPRRPRIELNVNRENPAVCFYRKMGLRVLRQGDFPIGQGFYMNDYIMGLEV